MSSLVGRVTDGAVLCPEGAKKDAIREGIESGIMHDFDPEYHLKKLKATKKLQGKLYHVPYSAY